MIRPRDARQPSASVGAVDLASKGDLPAVWAAIEALNPPIEPDVIFALVLARTGEENRERERLWRKSFGRAEQAEPN